ncbi:hypothetical protein [Gemmatimonas groenlandica]|uniref:Uncharacterized protein n=1 Tax=Gemmatimonas groenlandica TaxID=2732249 RepID=A0A6M4ITU3_9BACT|nr:hypothetical protein [Gemmatimonas groenlandica]QJR36262.1 hypothetical protein HKW67_12485 [Gemmatimonas groenlandica]
MNVTRNDNGHGPDADPRVTDLLRSHYAAPQDETYWHGLEERVLMHINVLRPSWWSGFGEFRTADIRNVGLIAATIGLLVAGATFVREAERNATAREMAQRAAVESALPLNDATLTSRVRVRLPEDAPERYLHPLDY